jgi:hypothetical protein
MLQAGALMDQRNNNDNKALSHHHLPLKEGMLQAGPFLNKCKKVYVVSKPSSNPRLPRKRVGKVTEITTSNFVNNIRIIHSYLNEIKFISFER